MWWHEIRQLREDLQKAAENKLQLENDIQSLNNQIENLKTQ